MWCSRTFLVFFFALVSEVVAQSGAIARSSVDVVRPLENHPGNIFVEGEEVRIQMPSGDDGPWTLEDYDQKIIAQGADASVLLNFGRLPVGYYELRKEGLARTISLGIVAPIQRPPSGSSSVSLDLALGWFFKETNMPAAINLARLAGANWLRDRYSWMDMEEARGKNSASNHFDAAVRLQAAAGFPVLQVNHYSPVWANTNQMRFPIDLRDAYRLHRELAKRWRGHVKAFEPWNEADIDIFGGHTGSEMASFQKAAFLGVKDGNPETIVCQNVFASHSRIQLRDFADNRVWPYFDTFNLHHYIDPEFLDQIYANFRDTSGGRPLWVTECNFPVKWTGNPKDEEPSAADLRIQAERVAKVYASALYQGAENVFYFTMRHYAEGHNQFGVLRFDLTPRPAYLALAAIGRLLVDAAPVARTTFTNSNLRAFWFKAKPGRSGRNVVVAWSREGNAELDLGVPTESVFDHLGRQIDSGKRSFSVTTEPRFFVLSEDPRFSVPLEHPAEKGQWQKGNPSPVVFQALWPEHRTLRSLSAYQMTTDQTETLTVYVYNFGTNVISGSLRVAAPRDWNVSGPDSIELAPFERKEIPINILGRSDVLSRVETLQLFGNFESSGVAILSVQIQMENNGPLKELIPQSVAGASHVSRWHPFVSGEGTITLTQSQSGVAVTAEPKSGIKWVYPQLVLNSGEQLDREVKAIEIDLQVNEGSGIYRIIFEEENGSSYMADLNPQPKVGTSIRVIAKPENAIWGANWSMPDQNARLNLRRVKSIRIGCNTTDEKVGFTINGLRWLRAKKENGT